MATTTTAADSPPTTTYDESGPPVGFAIAAQAGDLGAIQAAADWYRDRGQPADPADLFRRPGDEFKAYCIEVYKSHVEARMTMAKNLLALLERAPYLYPNPSPVPGVLTAKKVEDVVVGRYGLPVVHIMENGLRAATRWATVILPTDYQSEELVRERLTALLRPYFPNWRIDISFSHNAFGLASDGQAYLECETYEE